MKAITTRYFGPENARGSRFIASDGDGNRVIVPYDYSLNSSDNHAKAASALCARMKWTGELIGGDTGKGYAWVFASSDYRANKS